MPKCGKIDRDCGKTLATTAPDDDGPIWMIADVEDQYFTDDPQWGSVAVVNHRTLRPELKRTNT